MRPGGVLDQIVDAAYAEAGIGPQLARVCQVTAERSGSGN
jgi:hypothetical protein